MNRRYLLYSFLLILGQYYSQNSAAQVRIINTIAGNHIAGYSGDGGPATAAEFFEPVGVAFDALGNIFIADVDNNAIRKINISGTISTVLSGLNTPSGVAVDASNNLYIADAGLDMILKWSGGILTVVAGGAGTGYSGDGGPATLAKLHHPVGVAVDASGNLFIADAENNAVRKVLASSGNIYTIAGTGTAGYSGDGGPATAAYLRNPDCIALDVSGNVYIADELNNAIREIVASSGHIITLVGHETGGFGTGGFSGDGGPASAAAITYPAGVGVDISGNIYIVDGGNNRIRKINTSGIITTYAGDGTGGYTGYCCGGSGGYSGDGGPADSSELSVPAAIAFDASWNLYIADAGNQVIRKITPANGIYFNGGTRQSLSVCGNVSNPVDVSLAVIDTTAGETITWSMVSGPVHGILTVAYSAMATGGVITPAGLTYTPALYYTGPDSFTVKATNGSFTIYTTIILTVKAAPAATITASYSSICNGSSAKLIITGNGTPGGGDTALSQNFNASLGSWTVDTSGTVGTSPVAPFRDVPNDYSNELGTYYNPDSSSFALADAYGTGSATVTKSRLVSPSFSLAGYTNATLFFEQSYKKYTNDTNAEVDVSTDGGTTWTTLINYTLTYVTDLTAGIHPFTAQSVSLTAYAGLPNVKVRFYYNSKLGRYWALDNIVVVGYPTGIDAATWSPATDLFTSPGFTAPYLSGSYRDTLYMHPTTVTATTNFTYYATESIGACSVTDSITITVTPSVSITGNESVCVGANDTLADATPYGIWTATNANANVGFSSGVVTGITAGVDTIRYTTTGSCAGVATYTVSVSALPPAAGSISGPATVCTGASVTLSDAVPGGVWSTSVPGIATVGSTGVVTGVAVGSTAATYTVTNGCGSAIATAPLTVNPLPVAGTITGADSLCAGAAIPLSDIVAGGVWSSSASAFAAVGSTGTVTGVAVGNATISYSITNSCGTVSATKPVTINPLPLAGTITGSSSVCAGASIFLGDGIAGGTWSSGSTSIATAGTSGLITGISAGTTLASYTITNSCGTVSAVKSVTVNPLPLAGTVTGGATLCVGSGVSLSDTVTGGAWSSSAAGIASVGSAGAVTGVSSGNATISYSVTNSCGTVSAIKPVTVNPLPFAGTITGFSSVCSGTAITLSDVAAGGAWSSTPTSVATVGSSGMVTGISAGTAIISYTVTNSCGTVSALKSVTVNSMPLAGSIAGSSAVCVGSVIPLTDIVTGGSWSSSATGTAAAGSTGEVTGITEGVAVISYSVTNGCGTSAATKSVTVNPLPVAGTITGVETVCLLSTTGLADAAPGGTWSSLPATIAAIGSTGVVSGISTGSATVSYVVANSCGTAIATTVVTVNPLPVAGTITGAASVCAGAVITLSDITAGGIWTSSSSGIAVAGSTTGLVTGISAGVATITYTVTGSCGTAYAYKNVTVNPLPVAGTITGAATEVCAGATITLIDVVTGGTWYSSATTVAAVGSTGVVTGLSSGTAVIDYSLTNSCGTVFAEKTITVNPLPVAGTITGPATLCTGASITLSDIAAGGAWTSGAVGIATVGSTGTVTGITAGTDTIYYTVINSCGTAITTAMVSVNPAPVAGYITGADSVCALATITLTDSISGGTWSSSNLSATVSGGMVSGVFAGIDTISYIVSDICGADTAQKTIVIDPLPIAGPVLGASAVCTGASITLTDPVSGGSWYFSNSSAIVSGGLVTGISPGTDTLAYILTTTCGTDTATLIINVNPMPDAGLISGPSAICPDSSVTLTESVNDGIWTSLNSLAIITSSGIVTGVASGEDTVVYSVSDACGTAKADYLINILPDSVCSAVQRVNNIQFSSGTIVVYPDPNTGTFTLKVSSDIRENALIIITNLIGEKVKEFTTYTNREYEVNLEVPAGVYYLSASTHQGIYSAKMVVE